MAVFPGGELRSHPFRDKSLATSYYPLCPLLLKAATHLASPSCCVPQGKGRGSHPPVV